MSITELVPHPIQTGQLTVRVDVEPTAAELADWSGLVRRTPGADVAQLPGWARLRAGVGFTARYVLVRHGGELVGGAQLLERRVPLAGRLGYLQATLRLDLSQGVDELRAGLSKRLRTWTNRWAGRGVTVRRGTEADLALLAGLVADSGRHQRLAPVSEDYLRTLYRELGEDAVLFVSDVNGSPAAAALYTRCAGVLTLRFAGMDREGPAGRNNASAAVQWHALCWAKSAGLHRFDLGGISVEAADVLAAGGARDGLRGVDRFKSTLGGRVHRHPAAVELISGPITRAGYDLTRRWAPGRRAIELAKRMMRTGRVCTPASS